MKKMPFPATIPVIDLVSEINFPDSVYHARWTACHRQFADAQPNRQEFLPMDPAMLFSETTHPLSSVPS